MSQPTRRPSVGRVLLLGVSVMVAVAVPGAIGAVIGVWIIDGSDAGWFLGIFTPYLLLALLYMAYGIGQDILYWLAKDSHSEPST